LSSVVYWIHHVDHTDMFSQGYIGISSNVKKRWYDHKNNPSNAHLKHAIDKYGWDNLIKQVLIIADEAYCLAMELKLRATKQIGWNLVEGGGKPPSSLGKKFVKSEETRRKLSIANMGRKHKPETQAKINLNLTEGGKATRFVKGHVPHNKSKKCLPHVIEAIKKANTGRVHTAEEKEKRRLSAIGRKMSEYTKQRLLEANKGRIPAMKGKHFPKVACPHCGKEGGIIPMKRWHMDNCKFIGVK
jgi:group I intron endonuclease